MDSGIVETENEPDAEQGVPATENVNVKSKPKIIYRWKGKIVKESIYRQRIAVSESSKKRKISPEEEPKIPVEGRRVVDLQVLAKHLQCTSCKEILSLRNIKSETRRGLASIFHVQCHSCSVINNVPTTGKTPGSDSSKVKLYDVNTDFVKGSAQTDLTRYRLNKLLGCLNIPPIRWKLFHRYKQETQQAPKVPVSKKVMTENSPGDAVSELVEAVQSLEETPEMPQPS